MSLDLSAFCRRSLCLSLQAALLGPLNIWAANVVDAQDVSAPTEHFFNIAAGSLPQVLSQFAAQAGVNLSFDASGLHGTNSPGLHGSYTIDQGFAALLAGSAWRATPDAQGAYVLTVRRSTAPQSSSEPNKVAMPLSPTATAMDAIHVTAESQNATTQNSGSYTTKALTLGKSEYSMREIPQSVSVVTRQRMDDQNLVTATQALEQTTGITLATNTNPYLNDAFYARGYELTSELDGIPSTGSLNVGAPQFDLAMYDRIEVIRGSAGLLEGSGEPGGLVNFARKRPTNDVEVSGSASGGSWDNLHSDFDVSGPLSSDKSLRGRIVVADTSTDKFYDHSDRQSQMAYGIIEYDLGVSTLMSLSATVQHDRTHGILSGIQSYSTGELFYLSPSDNPFPGWTGSSQDTREVFAELDHYFHDGWHLRASMRYRDTDTDAHYVGLDSDVDPSTDEVSYFPAADTTKFQWLAADVNASGSFDLFGRTHQLLVGTNYDQEKSRDQYSGNSDGIVNIFQLAQLPEPAIPLIGDYRVRTEQFGMYGQVRLSLFDSMSLIMGGRITHYQQYTGNGDYGTEPNMPRSPGGVDHKFTPYAGLIYDVSGNISLYASYSQIFVPQSELTASGAPLPPRTGEQTEVGAKGEFFQGKLNASAAIFDLKDRNRAYYSSDVFFYSAAGEVRMNGTEFEVGGSPLPGWNLSAGYTYLDPHYRTAQDAANLADITPRHNVKAWNTYQFQGGALLGFSIGGGLTASSGWSSSNWSGLPVHAPGYTVASVQVGYHINTHWGLTLTINNALNRTYFQALTTAGGFYGDPRNMMLTVRAKY